MKKLLNSHGDTLIEVSLALAILGLVIAVNYSLLSRAWQLGQAAKERTQAINLLQEQAEAARSLRESASSWADFKTAVGGISGGATFPRKVYFKYDSVANDWAVHFCAADAMGNVTDANCGFRQFKIFAAISPAGACLSGDPVCQLKFTYTAEWPNRSGGNNSATMSTYLVDKSGIKPL